MANSSPVIASLSTFEWLRCLYLDIAFVTFEAKIAYEPTDQGIAAGRSSAGGRAGILGTSRLRAWLRHIVRRRRHYRHWRHSRRGSWRRR